MNKTKLGLLATTLSALMLSVGAYASTLGTSAAVPGPGGGGEVGGEPVQVIPGGGGGSCYFAYHIRKISLDRDHHHDHDGGPVAALGDDDDRDVARFRIILTNIGNCDLRRIDVTDFLPRGTELVRAEPEPDDRFDDKLIWRDVRLFVGERADFDVVVKRRDHDDHRDFRVQNTGCAFTPFIGIRICDSAIAFLDDHDHDHDHDHSHQPGLN